MGYVLEHPEEFDRLERQSALPAYDHQSDLGPIDVREGAFILDAGCGSGVISRYLANRFPKASVIGCDYTASLLQEARRAGFGIGNLRFQEQNLKALDYDEQCFDLIVCRFVLHHQDPEGRARILSELVRVLRSGGKIIAIDIDGGIPNLYPQTRRVTEGLRLLSATEEIDLFIGRKLPYLFHEAGLVSISWTMQAVDFQGTHKESELQLMRERFQNAAAFFQRIVGSGRAWREFQEEYLDCFQHPCSVVVLNKFIVSGLKA